MTVKEWLNEEALSQGWLGQQLGMSQQGVSWSLKHGFHARHFPGIVRLSNGKVSLEDLAKPWGQASDYGKEAVGE